MLESVLGLLTPCARQNEGRLVNVCPAGVTSVPDVTTVAAVMLVFPSNVNDVKPEQETGLPASRSRAQRQRGALPVLRKGAPAPRGARTAALTHDPEVGDRIDQYQLTDLLARGGMASIFKAIDSESGAAVVLKIPYLQYESDVVFFERFRREEEIGQRLDHPGI